MARELWLLRHADAEPHGTRPDAERELTPRGRDQARWAAEALRALGVEPERVWSSPKVRARDTAVAVASSFEERDVLASGFDGKDALELAAELSGDGSAILVGHNPDFEQAIADLTGSRIDLKKGGVAMVRLGAGSSDLLVLMRPGELRQVAQNA